MEYKSFKERLEAHREKCKAEWCRENGISTETEEDKERAEIRYLQYEQEQAEIQRKAEQERKAELEAEKAKMKEYQDRERWENLMAQIPPIYKEASINDFGKGIQPKIQQMLDGSSALILGENGLGKTHLSWAILKELTKKGKRVKYVKAQLLLYEIKKHQDNIYDFIQGMYGKLDCLVIDEIDKIFESKADFIYLNYLIDYRYEWARQTIVMGNGDKGRFIESLGQSIYSRLRGNNGMDIALSGNDRRISANKE